MTASVPTIIKVKVNLKSLIKNIKYQSGLFPFRAKTLLPIALT